jgi:transcriptional regulator with XRE-family HTH domain
MKNRENFDKLVSENTNPTLERIKERIKNRALIRESQKTALKILTKLDELGWTQIRLATVMQVSPQYVNKIVKGKENLTTETMLQIQEILDIPLLASYYEDKKKQADMPVLKFAERFRIVNPEAITQNYGEGKFARGMLPKEKNEYLIEEETYG